MTLGQRCIEATEDRAGGVFLACLAICLSSLPVVPQKCDLSVFYRSVCIVANVCYLSTPSLNIHLIGIHDKAVFYRPVGKWRIRRPVRSGVGEATAHPDRYAGRKSREAES